MSDQNLHRREPFRLLGAINRWRGNPIGFLVRAIEYLAFGQPLHTLLRTGLAPDVMQNDYLIEEFSDVRVDVPSGIISTSTGRVIAPYLTDRYFMSGNFFADIFRLVRRKHQNFYFGQECFVIPVQDYYFHFMMEWVPRILLLAKVRPNVKFLVATNPQYVYEFLRMQNLDFEVVNQKSVRVGKLVALESRLDRSASLQLIRNSLLKKEECANKQVFISRRGYSRYNLRAEQTIEKTLGENVLRIDPGQLSLSEQISLFQSVSEVHAIHGGALTNLVFMSPGTRVVEYFTTTYRHYCFREIAQTIGIEYREVAT
jgi:capsular polysaccharide biosynthesis protein